MSNRNLEVVKMFLAHFAIVFNPFVIQFFSDFTTNDILASITVNISMNGHVLL